MPLRAALVDALPPRLWRPGNLLVPRFGLAAIGTWHFCVAAGEDGHTARTVERSGRVVARGRRTVSLPPHRPED